MSGKVKFYRGTQGTSLPATYQDGAIFIIERIGSNNLGDMYVDMDNGKRLHIIPDKDFIVYDPSLADATSPLGQVYLFQDADKNGIAVGDGVTNVGNLPLYNATTRNVLRNKINAYIGTEYMNLDSQLRNKDKNGSKTLSSGITNPAETLVLTRELWLDF